MKKLKEVTVLGQRIRIEYRKPKKESYGEFFPLEHKIALNSNLKDEELIRTRNHEVFHAGLKVSGLDQWLSDEQQEALCCLFESLYDDVIRIHQEGEE